MTTLYTSVGRLELRADGKGRRPIIRVAGKENEMNIHEMLVWTCLAWRVLDLAQLEELYCQKAWDTGLPPVMDIQTILDRLLRRDLAAVGIGETGADALHDLFSDLYIVPATGGIIAKTIAFLRLILLYGLPFRKTAGLFRTDKLPPAQKRVMDLAQQSLMSTSEIIKGVEEGAYDVSTDEKLLDAIYYDDYTTSDNIGFYARTFKAWKPALIAVANLYLRQLILLERI
jgi:hypothetical protein